jgi:hypothetical protein
MTTRRLVEDKVTKTVLTLSINGKRHDSRTLLGTNGVYFQKLSDPPTPRPQLCIHERNLHYVYVEYHRGDTKPIYCPWHDP